MGIIFHFTQYSWLDLNTVILTHVRFFCEDYDDFSNNDRKPRPHLSHYFFIIFGTRAKWNNLQHVVESVPYNMSLVVRKSVFGFFDQV